MLYKYFFLTIFLLCGLSAAHVGQKNVRSLCTYNNASFAKCQMLVETARNSSINLPLQCVQENNLQNCLRTVRLRRNSMLVIAEHDYDAARRYGLTPVLFARQSNKSLYIAVAQRNITLVNVYEAPITANLTNERAYHAALYFNLMRGRTICANISNAENGTIRILDSAVYQPNDDEILICPNRLYGTANDTERCNFEAGLQTAVFVPRRAFDRKTARNIKGIFDNILQNFGPNSNNNFNFFTTFNGTDNVIFENNIIGFDLRPTYRNGVTERVFNYLHCNGTNKNTNF